MDVCLYRLCGTKCDVQAAFLNYLDGFAIANSQYSNFTLSNVRISLNTPTQSAQDIAKQAQQQAKAAKDLVSPRGEKAYEERVSAWRLKRIQAYTHSRIQWALSDGPDKARRREITDQSQALGEDMDLLDNESFRDSLRRVSTIVLLPYNTCLH